MSITVLDASGIPPEPSYINEDAFPDRVIDIRDVSVVGQNWLSENCNSGNSYCNRADVTRNGKIDILDASAIGHKWLYSY